MRAAWACLDPRGQCLERHRAGKKRSPFFFSSLGISVFFWLLFLFPPFAGAWTGAGMVGKSPCGQNRGLLEQQRGFFGAPVLRNVVLVPLERLGSGNRSRGIPGGASRAPLPPLTPSSVPFSSLLLPLTFEFCLHGSAASSPGSSHPTSVFPPLCLQLSLPSSPFQPQLPGKGNLVCFEDKTPPRIHLQDLRGPHRLCCAFGHLMSFAELLIVTLGP